MFRKRAAQYTCPIDHDLSNPLYPACDSDDEILYLPQESNDTPSKETLLAAFFSISRRWADEAYNA